MSHFEIGFGNTGVEVTEEDLLPLRVFGTGAPVENAAGERGAEPELMPDLLYGDFRTGIGMDRQSTHPVSNGRVEVGIGGTDRRFGQKEEEADEISDCHGRNLAHLCHRQRFSNPGPFSRE